MKNHKFTIVSLLLFVIVPTFHSCFGNKSDYDEQKKKEQDSIWNECIQRAPESFFDTKFGLYREDLIKNFNKNGLTESRQMVTTPNEEISFLGNEENPISYWGIEWGRVRVSFNDNRFDGITFITSTGKTYQAYKTLNDLKKVLSDKNITIETNNHFTPEGDIDITEYYGSSSWLDYNIKFNYKRLESDEDDDDSIYYVIELNIKILYDESYNPIPYLTMD